MIKYKAGSFILDRKTHIYYVTKTGKGIITCRDNRNKTHYIWDKDIVAYYTSKRSLEEGIPARDWFRKEYAEYFI